MKSVSNDIIDTISKLRRWEDKHLSLFGKLLLINGLNLYGIDSNSLVKLKYSKFGKPFLDNGISFNISHSNNYVSCVLSRKGNVGVDIEFIDNNIDILSFKEIFTTTEWQAILDSANKINAFYRLWCQKESVIKADGRGFSAPLKKFKLDQDHVVLDNQAYYTKEIFIDADYKYFVAHNAPIEMFMLKRYIFE